MLLNILLMVGKTVSDAKKKHGYNLASNARTARICGEKKKKMEGMYNAVIAEEWNDKRSSNNRGEKEKREIFRVALHFLFEEAGGSFVTLDHEYFGMYKWCCFALLFSLFLFSFVSLCQVSQLKSKFKAYLINRHSVSRVCLCPCARYDKTWACTRVMYNDGRVGFRDLTRIALLSSHWTSSGEIRGQSRNNSDSEHVGFRSRWASISPLLFT